MNCGVPGILPISRYGACFCRVECPLTRVVRRHRTRHRPCIGERHNNPLAHAHPAPAREAVGERPVRAVPSLGIPSARTGPGHVYDPVDHTAVVEPRNTASIPRDKRLKPPQPASDRQLRSEDMKTLFAIRRLGISLRPILQIVHGS